MSAMMGIMGKIFISHAVADKDLVDAFVDFLQTGCGVKHEDMFCSSLEGMTIPEGSSFVHFMEDTLREADFVSLHCPGSPENHHLIDAKRLALMKPSAILINTARGDVVDNQALIAALRERRIAAAGLDVYEGEPALDPGFLTLENVALLPHLGSATLETRVAMGMKVIDNAEAFFRGETPPDLVA